MSLACLALMISYDLSNRDFCMEGLSLLSAAVLKYYREGVELVPVHQRSEVLLNGGALSAKEIQRHTGGAVDDYGGLALVKGKDRSDPSQPNPRQRLPLLEECPMALKVGKERGLIPLSHLLKYLAQCL